MTKRTGLKDIAKALNVSITTVSRALNDKIDINAATKKMILDKADELNYRRNAYAVSLRKNEYFTIGVVLPSIDHYFFSTVLKGIMNKAHMANYLVIVGETNHKIDKEKEILEQFIAHCVTGVIISPTKHLEKTTNLELLTKRRVPYILVDRPSLSDDAAFVKHDDEKGAFLAVEHLIEQGFSKIAFLKGLDQCIISNARLKGFKAAMRKHNLEINPKFIKSSACLDGTADGYQFAKQLLLNQDRPDAFFTVTDNVAIGVYQAAKELNISIPTELGIVGYSNSKISAFMSPPLTTVEQPGREMGEQAFDFLQQKIIGNKTQLSKTFDARVILRASSIRKTVELRN